MQFLPPPGIKYISTSDKKQQKVYKILFFLINTRFLGYNISDINKGVGTLNTIPNGELAKFIGEKIKSFRKTKKMTQQDLADKIGRSQNAVSNYEKGINAPTQDTLFLLADVFDISVDDLFPEREFVLGDDISSDENANLSNDDLKFLDDLTAYINSLEETDRKKLLSNINLAVELFKK